MAAEYATANEWYKANRRDLKKYRGEWIAYTKHLKVQNTERVEMLVDSGAERSLITKQLGENLGCSSRTKEIR